MGWGPAGRREWGIHATKQVTKKSCYETVVTTGRSYYCRLMKQHLTQCEDPVKSTLPLFTELLALAPPEHACLLALEHRTRPAHRASENPPPPEAQAPSPPSPRAQ